VDHELQVGKLYTFKKNLGYFGNDTPVWVYESRSTHKVIAQLKLETIVMLLELIPAERLNQNPYCRIMTSGIIGWVFFSLELYEPPTEQKTSTDCNISPTEALNY